MKQKIKYPSFAVISTAVLYLVSCGWSNAQIIQSLPTPMQQGGMVHVNVTFQDQSTGSFTTHTDPGSPELRPLQQWSGFESNTFDPADPWYTGLDPSQENRLFGNRFGFALNTTASDFLPAGTSIGIRMTSRSTPGLNAYFYNSSTPLFDPVFLSSASHDYVLWNGTMWHTVFTAPNGTSGTVSADFELFLADTSGTGAVDYTTLASAQPGYDTTSFTLSYNAVPEPGSLGLFLMGVATLFVKRWRRPNG